MVRKVTLRRLYDMHVHFRGLKSASHVYYDDDLMAQVAPFTMRYCRYAMIMPNPKPRAILTAQDVRRYRGHIEKVMSPRSLFTPLMTIEIRDNTTPKMVQEAHAAGVFAGKVYPASIYGEGLRSFSGSVSETFTEMQRLKMPVLLHGELNLPKILVTKREEVFLPTMAKLADCYPDLKIVLEHVSSKEGVRMVKKLGPNVAATITAHHLCTTLNDVVGNGIQPHHMCNPIPKDFSDKDALWGVIRAGNPKFFLGSDSAPHAREKKECARGACGAFTAPILPQLLAELFEISGLLDRLGNFSSVFPAQFYGLPLATETITLENKPWTVPDQYGSVVPFMAGQRLQYQLV